MPITLLNFIILFFYFILLRPKSDILTHVLNQQLASQQQIQIAY